MAIDIKVTMLGPSGSGKTCYLIGMFTYLECGFNGFTLSTPNRDEGLELNDLYDRMCEEHGDQRWPLGTQESKSYKFHFNWAFNKLLGFDWLDYRGGALQERNESKEAETLHQHLLNSYCVLICISAEDLLTLDEFKLRRRLGVNRINQFISETAEKAKEENKRLPLICLTITKGDYIDPSNKDEVYAKIRSLFTPFFTDGSRWEVGITPVTLGKALASDKNDGEIEPIGIHFPVCFLVQHWYEDAVRLHEGENNRLQDRHRAITSYKPGFWDSLFGGNEKSGEIANINEQKRQVEATLQQMKANIARIKGVVNDGVEVYNGGVKI